MDLIRNGTSASDRRQESSESCIGSSRHGSPGLELAGPLETQRRGGIRLQLLENLPLASLSHRQDLLWEDSQQIHDPRTIL